MKKIIKSRKFRLILACISLLLLIDMIQDSYAKYVSSAEASSTFAIARWAFTVNNQDVISNSDFSSTILPSFDTNSNIESGVIAPTSTGHFEVTIDSSDVEVAFDEVITLSQGEDNTVTDIVFTGYKINNGSIIQLVNQTNPTITTHHNLNEQNTVNTYYFYIEWTDVSTATMDNVDDTDASISGNASIDINLQFIQRAAAASSSSSGNSSSSSSSSEPSNPPSSSSN